MLGCAAVLVAVLAALSLLPPNSLEIPPKRPPLFANTTSILERPRAGAPLTALNGLWFNLEVHASMLEVNLDVDMALMAFTLPLDYLIVTWAAIEACCVHESLTDIQHTQHER